jgi:hypothetical protein
VGAPAELSLAVQQLKAMCGPSVHRATMGEQKRQAGGLALRTGKRPAGSAAAEALPSA